ncbi:helix-turn-helix domain-containing protein [Bradyrhizobium valentinum]|uniref:Helix-turn-helix domain-containing protein n=1 Tax=Bradyrhizobium valentinum TaxID=1518501 RepID=A0A0R3M3J1_9BRAD|nr:helix-turn-helix domain-containing protein [Bradyrhizobium valentinum]KRR14529.1 hypothetical protein CP49_25800 [Bradyrhizobium valentinum]
MTKASQPSTFLERDEWMRAVLASDLPRVAVCVAVAIGLHLNVKTGRCDPSFAGIATASHVSERTVYRLVSLLEHSGWIALQRTGGRQRNQYTLLNPDTAPTGLNPDTTPTGFDDANPDRAGNSTLTETASNPDNRWQTISDKRRDKAADAATSAAGERERRSRSLADSPGALAPNGGAPEGFEVLWSLWSSARLHNTGQHEAEAWRVYAIVCRDAATRDEIMTRAQRYLAAKADDRRHIHQLANWLSNDNWRKPPPEQKRTRKSREPTAGEILLRKYGDRS